MRTYNVNETSKLIKKTLMAAWPDVKFSVRLEKYSMGHSIDARWTDGPTSGQVKAILDRFDGQGFDGMTDCSFYCGERMYHGEKVDFHSGYVRGNRNYSPEFMRLVAAHVAKECGVNPPTINAHGSMESGYESRVPFQWWKHWNDNKDLTFFDLLSSRKLLAHDSHEGGGEWLSNLINRIADSVSLKPIQRPVELPEYIDIEEKASTGRADFEEPMRKFEGHEALEVIQ